MPRIKFPKRKLTSVAKPRKARRALKASSRRVKRPSAAKFARQATRPFAKQRRTVRRQKKLDPASVVRESELRRKKRNPSLGRRVKPKPKSRIGKFARGAGKVLGKATGGIGKRLGRAVKPKKRLTPRKRPIPLRGRKSPRRRLTPNRRRGRRPQRRFAGKG